MMAITKQFIVDRCKLDPQVKDGSKADAAVKNCVYEAACHVTEACPSRAAKLVCVGEHQLHFFFFDKIGRWELVLTEGIMAIEEGETKNDLGSGNGDLCPSLMPTGIANSGHEVGVFGEVRKCLQQKNSVGFANLEMNETFLTKKRVCDVHECIQYVHDAYVHAYTHNIPKQSIHE